MKAEVAARVSLQGDRRRYLAPLLVEFSERISEVRINHHPRFSGESKYTFPRSVALILRFCASLFQESFDASRFSARQDPSGLPGNPGKEEGQRDGGRTRPPLFEIREVLEEEPGR